MQKINFAEAKKQIEEIAKVVEVCPEPLRETCFKMLFELAFSDRPAPLAPQKQTPAIASEPPSREEPARNEPAAPSFKLPPNVLVFTRKYDIAPDTLQKLFILDHEPMLPIYNITSKVMRTAQLQKVLMILLENGLLTGKFSASYAELRETINEVGLFDSNFGSGLKKNHALFKGAITAEKINEAQTVELTGPGLEQLAATIKELTQ